jgi:LysM repeat protein
MVPRTLRLTVMTATLAGLAFLAIPPLLLSQEDTAHLVLRKKAAATESPSIYVVQKGDNLSTIIRRKMGKPAEFTSVYRLVKKLNPQIRDVNVIYPGQKIVLPQLSAAPDSPHYTVNKGDTLSGILRNRLGIAPGDIARWVGIVKQLNPGLGDPNKIYPGQTLILTDKKFADSLPVDQGVESAPAGVAPIDAGIFRPSERDFDIISAVVKQAGGTLIRKGKYFIPLSENEHLAVDCTDIPMVELFDGSRIFLDYGHRVPDETTMLMRSRWKNVTVITQGGGAGVFSALTAIFNASRDFTFRRHDGYLDMEATPALKLRVDWILARKGAEGQERYLLGICHTAGPSQTLPEPIARFAEKKGYPVIEIDEKSGDVRERQALPSASDIPTLEPGGNRTFVGSLLDALGYPYTTDQRIPVVDATSQGTPLVIRTDYSVKIGTRTVLIHFGDLPASFQATLQEQGMGLVQIAGDEEKKVILEKVLKGIDIPYLQEYSEFKPPEDGNPSRWILTLGAMRLTSEKGAIYLVPADADRDLCAFIHEHWNRRIIRY